MNNAVRANNVGLVAASAAAIGTSAIAGSPALPLDREPHHHVVFENRIARILDVRIAPGELTKYHVHANPLVGITIRSARSWLQAPGAPKSAVSPRGEEPSVGDNWEQALPYTHRVANADVVPSHAVVVEWLGRANEPCRESARTGNYRPVESGRFVRVYKTNLKPRLSLVVSACPGALVQATAGLLRIEGAPPDASGGSGAGRWFWSDAQHPYVVRNVGSKAIILYRIDWK